jgi:hypothetical protein
MTNEPDYDASYRILDLEPGAGIEEIDTRWRLLAFAWHPDKFAAGPLRDRFERELQKINTARDELKKYWRAHGAPPPTAGRRSAGGVPPPPTRELAPEPAPEPDLAPAPEPALVPSPSAAGLSGIVIAAGIIGSLVLLLAVAGNLRSTPNLPPPSTPNPVVQQPIEPPPVQETKVAAAASAPAPAPAPARPQRPSRCAQGEVLSQAVRSGEAGLRSYIRECRSARGAFVSDAETRLESLVFASALTCIRSSCAVAHCVESYTLKTPSSAHVRNVRDEAYQGSNSARCRPPAPSLSSPFPPPPIITSGGPFGPRMSEGGVYYGPGPPWIGMR